MNLRRIDEQLDALKSLVLAEKAAMTGKEKKGFEKELKAVAKKHGAKDVAGAFGHVFKKKDAPKKTPKKDKD